MKGLHKYGLSQVLGGPLQLVVLRHLIVALVIVLMARASHGGNSGGSGCVGSGRASDDGRTDQSHDRRLV
jgi:hypothetical protein